MDTVSSLVIERFKRLPRRSDECWQGGLVRLPAWVEDQPGRPPRRLWAGFWVSLRTGLAHFKSAKEPSKPDWSLALEALLEFGLKSRLANCRPARLEVSDQGLGTQLLAALGDPELALGIEPDLPAVRQVLAWLDEGMAGKPSAPSALDAPGVTIERMRSFADAADRFYRAAPWQYLTDADLIRVEAPLVSPDLQYCTVLGAGGETFGLGFYQSPEAYQTLSEARGPDDLPDGVGWSVLYGPLWDLPFGDADLWEDHALPVAGESAYPLAMHFGAGGLVRRPDRATLSTLEAILRALAETTEEEMDQGRWTRPVTTGEGTVTVQLAIPALLEPVDAPPAPPRPGLPDRRIMERVLVEMERAVGRGEFDTREEVDEMLQRRFVGDLEAIPSTAATPLERAQDLAYRAVEAQGRRRRQLARKALELSPDCADAYVLLAEQTADLARACELYAQGVAAGERALGPRVFAEEAGRFWSLLGTRPYMRARFGLAQCLDALGRRDEALAHYRELLRLNPDDNQGVRSLLLGGLLAAGRDEEAGALLAQFGDEGTALWEYGWALWTFRRDGDSPGARARLQRAIRANRHVPGYLTGARDCPDCEPDAYTLGSEEEAVICARTLGEAWRATPGAEGWLAIGASATGKRSRRRGRR